MRAFLRQPGVAVGPHVVGAGGNVEILGVSRVRRLQVVLRHVALRIEHHRHFALIDFLFTDRVIVHVEPDLGAGLHEPAGALREDVAVLADGVLVEEPALEAAAAADQLLGAGLVLNQVGHRVVHDLLGAGRGLGLDRLEVAIFGEAGVDDVVAPPVGAGRRNGVRFRLHDEIGLADLPDVVVLELDRRRHVRRVAAERPAVDPARDRRDFLVAQRRIVVELPRRRPCDRCTTAASRAA